MWTNAPLQVTKRDIQRARRSDSRRRGTYRRFLKTVETLGRFDEPTAQRVTIAVLSALEHRLYGSAPRKLEAQFPAMLRQLLHFSPVAYGIEPAKFRRELFLELISLQLGVSNQVAETTARAVLAAVRAHISKGEVEHVSKLLPNDIRELWAGHD